MEENIIEGLDDNKYIVEEDILDPNGEPLVIPVEEE